MSLLMSDEIKRAIYRELESATESAQIITAFCKKNAISILAKHISEDVKSKRLLLRFRLSDLTNGSSDFAVLDFCRENGWQVYIRFDLHAKTYIIDNSRGIVGSANATRNGLSLNGGGNLEIATFVDLSSSDIKKINMLFDEAIQVTDDLYEELKRQYINVDIPSNVHSIAKWSQSIVNMFTPDVNTLFSYDLPEKPDITADSIGFLDISNESAYGEVREAFMWCRAYLWLKKILREHGGEIYFGELSAALHAALIEDPKPYRKDVKILLSNLLKWIEKLDITEVVIDRPNYSQRIRLM